MTESQAKNKIRRQKRKDVIEWYRFLKKRMMETSHIEDGFMIGMCFYLMPTYGQKVAARLLCFKDKRFVIRRHETLFIEFLCWRFNV